MTETDKNILRELQSDFPLTTRPFEAAGRRLGLSEDALLRRLNTLKKRGLIRHCGPVFDLQKLDLHSTLVAMAVPARRLQAVTSLINDYPHVTHNYLRESRYNIWFTVTAGSRKELARIINEIKGRTGITDVMDLRRTKMFKKRAVFA